MCQPGRPGPMRCLQTGSPSLGAFHSAKSRASAFSYSSHVHARAGADAAEIVVRELAVLRESSRCGSRPSRRWCKCSRLPLSFSMASHHLVDVLGGRRQPLRPLQTQRLRSPRETPSCIWPCTPSMRLVLRHRVADDLVVHVGDVHDVVELEAAARSQRRRMSTNVNVRKLPMWAKS